MSDREIKPHGFAEVSHKVIDMHLRGQHHFSVEEVEQMRREGSMFREHRNDHFRHGQYRMVK